MLYIIETDESNIGQYSSIKAISEYPEEDEYLININNFFKISLIHYEELWDYYCICLKFSTIDEVKLNMPELIQNY